jgi:hypothetical protein
MSKLKLFLAIFVSAFFCACVNNAKPENREDQLSKGYRMMDENRANDAIEYFTELYQTDHHYKVQLALASAYAFRAGVRIEKIWSFASTFVTMKPVNLASTDNTAVLAQRLQMLSQFLQAWSKIPTVSTSGFDDLKSALDILNEGDVPGVRLYSAILRMIVLKASVAQGVQSWSVNGQTMCVLNAQDFFQWSQKVLTGLSFVAYDLEKSYPAESEKYENIRVQILNLQTQNFSGRNGEALCL